MRELGEGSQERSGTTRALTAPLAQEEGRGGAGRRFVACWLDLSV